MKIYSNDVKIDFGEKSDRVEGFSIEKWKVNRDLSAEKEGEDERLKKEREKLEQKKRDRRTNRQTK